MLRRQQAEAIIAARQKIVHGAVSMVEMALKELAEKNVVELDEERKAAMVSNLLVVLCGESEVHAGRQHRHALRLRPPMANPPAAGPPRPGETRKAFLLRIDPALFAEIEKWAADEFRSVNGQIEYLLRDAVRARRRGRARSDSADATGREF